MSHVMVEFDRNWADEYDVKGFILMTREEWDEHVALINDFGGWPVEQYFGSNEWFDIEDADDYLSAFEVTDLLVSEYAVLSKFFNYGASTVELLELYRDEETGIVERA